MALALTLLAFRLPLGPSVALLWQGAFGDRFAVARTLVKATPLLLTGLGMVVAWRSATYNIGGEGQFVLGGLGAATLFRFVPLPPGIGQVALLGAAAVAGAGWALLAGWLAVRRGVEVVIGTILLNFVALQALSYAVSGPLQERARQLPLTDALPRSLMLWRPDRRTDLHLGVAVALLFAGVVWLLLFRSVAGYRMRLTGAAPGVARAYRVDGDRSRLAAMGVSGALCGLAGGVEYLGLAGQLGTSFSQGWGFLGIPVALLGGLHPLGAAVAALFFGALFAGSENLGRFTEAGPTLVFVVQAVAVLAYVALSRRRGEAA